MGQDPANVYFPKLDRHNSHIRDEKEFPLALVLQGALVDKEFYSTVATERSARWSALFLRAEILKDPQASRYLYRTG